MKRIGYPSDVSDEEWAFVAPYLTLMKEEAPQRVYSLREVFKGLRWIIRAGAPFARSQERFCPVATARVVERSFAWAARFRRLARDYERLPETLAGLTYLAVAILMLKNFVHVMAFLL